MNSASTNKTKESKDLLKEHEQLSEQTLSIQNFEFPDTKRKDTKGSYKVLHKTELLQKPASKTEMAPKQRGYDFTSSTNSHFEDWLFPVPRKFRHKCPSTSSEERNRDSESEISSKEKPESGEKPTTSQELINSQRILSDKPTRFNGPEWRQPCKESFVAGAPPKFVGTCAHNIENIAKMSKARQKFFLTQDPRRVHCLVNPDVLRAKEYSKKKEFDTLTKMVKHAQNTCASDAGSEPQEDFLCEVIDFENPLQLDFQGLDYKNTYQRDEQDLLNQRNYIRMCRYEERKRIKAQTKIKVEEAKHQEKLQVPACLRVCEREIQELEVPPPEPPKFAKLLRSESKPSNRNKISMERSRREKRYSDLYLENRERKINNENIAKQEQKEHERYIGLITANETFENIITDIDTVVQRSFQPETAETEQCDVKSIKERSRIIHKPFNKSDKFNKASEDSLQCSEDSSGYIGKEGNIFRLRGFQTKSSKLIRGRNLEDTTLKMQGCMTREQWLMELTRKKEKVKLDVEVGVQKSRGPDDPKLILFEPNKYTPPKTDISEIKEFTLKPLGRHYDKELRKSLRYVKPRLRYSVKKFNLVSYRFGDASMRLAQIEDPLADQAIDPSQLTSTPEYMQMKALRKRRRLEEDKMKRLKLLGIPCKKLKKSRLQTKCENSSSSSDSEWVPEKESDYQSEIGKEIQENVRDIMPLSRRTNMPAPKFREPTLRQHPRRRRDYELQRVPSDIFDDVVLKSNHPYMYKIPADTMEPANANLKKRPYLEMFEARHHHDHWNPTQEQMVDVHYQPHLVEPKTTTVMRKADRVAIENFNVAQPLCKQYVDKNITMPKWDMNEVIEVYRKSEAKSSHMDFQTGGKTPTNRCKQQDYVKRSRDPQELKNLDYPGRKEYLKLLQDANFSINESKEAEDPTGRLNVNKTASLEALDDDIKSIQSCLTSLSSSQCTNFTNDSGSFLLMEGKEKVPLDYIRKSLVPFEELHRSRFQAEPIDLQKEENNPFNVLPFSGQRKAQLEMTTPKDNFFTFSTRLRNGLRLRLEVPVEDVRKKLIGTKSHKFNCLVATDIDEHYVEVLKCRPAIRTFKFKTGSLYIKDALRLKFESMLIQGEMVRTKIYDRLNEQHWTDMQKLKVLYEELFAKWEKIEYDAAMAVVYKVKAFYDETDRLKTELKHLDKTLVMLNMDIVFLEGHWIRCVMLQNFHYLLGDQKWRQEHDWIHRLETDDDDEVRMENYEVSIMKRSKINIRQRDKDNAWAIKAYYEDVYLPNKHANLIVFPNANSFLLGVENLKGKTFVLLLEMHFTLSIHMELQGRLETFIEWCAEDLKEKRDYVSRKCAKLYFMEDRAAWLKKLTLDYLGAPIEASLNDEVFLRDHGIIAEAWRRIVPENMRGGSSELETVEMVAMMSDVVMELINKFESIPMDESRIIEQKLRARRSYLSKLSRHACYIERRIEQEMTKVIKNLEPVQRKYKRPKKLPRYYLKKRAKSIQLQETKISDKARFFYEAFNEDIGGPMTASDIKESLAQVATVQENIVPFYFDHFLKLNGYTPNYNFKTQVEIRDGPEYDRMQVRSAIPTVHERMQQWEIIRRKIMDEHIAQNPNMYVDVV